MPAIATALRNPKVNNRSDHKHIRTTKSLYNLRVSKIPIPFSHISIQPDMDPNFKFPGSPGTPLFQVSPERVNQQRASTIFDDSPSGSPHRHSRESSVHEKVAAFNSLAFQGKQLERKANDAALKRAMLGREEAESEMRRYREETQALRRQVEEGKERERRVGERLENVMVSALWLPAYLWAVIDCLRKTMAVPKKHTRIRRHYGRKRSGERAKSRSSHNQRS